MPREIDPALDNLIAELLKIREPFCNLPDYTPEKFYLIEKGSTLTKMSPLVGNVGGVLLKFSRQGAFSNSAFGTLKASLEKYDLVNDWRGATVEVLAWLTPRWLKPTGGDEIQRLAAALRNAAMGTLTMTEAAAELNVSVGQMSKLLSSGKVAGEKLQTGKVSHWRVDRASVEGYRARRRLK